jgi:hypothetical protein
VSCYCKKSNCVQPPNAVDLWSSMQQDQEPDERPGADDRPNGKKPYVKPSYEFERAFETMALSCGKINITQMQCKFNRKSS